MATVQGIFNEKDSDNFLNYLESGKYSDVIISTRDREYNAHAMMIYHRSPCFQKMLDGSFKEGQERLIKLHDDDPEAITQLLRYCYTNSYPTASNAEPTRPRTAQKMTDLYESLEDQLLRDLNVYIVADKYQLKDLQEKAANHFEKLVKAGKITIDIVPVIQAVNDMEIPNDTRLRDVLIGALAPELGTWLKNLEFTDAISQEAGFCSALMYRYACDVESLKKETQVVLNPLDDPGKCSVCHHVLWLRRKRTSGFGGAQVATDRVEKYCDQCRHNGQSLFAFGGAFGSRPEH